MNVKVRVGPEGRVLLPAEVRRAIGLRPGEILSLRVEGDHLVLIPQEAIRRRLQEQFKDVEGSMAEELIAERRSEAKRDVTG